MDLVNLLIALALIQYAVFGWLVGRARYKYGVRAPAASGNEMFERYYRVQMNTLELLVLLLPAAWLASRYHGPVFVSVSIGIYIVGRIVYFMSYLSHPEKRSLGFGMSFLPILVLLGAGLLGPVRALLGMGG
ncbi:MAG TPA: MAPEG family protein [Paucimonas sp.]|nr:MAPEG family protein [Paucimonas sp.]